MPSIYSLCMRACTYPTYGYFWDGLHFAPTRTFCAENEGALDNFIVGYVQKLLIFCGVCLVAYFYALKCNFMHLCEFRADDGRNRVRAVTIPHNCNK